MYFFGILLHSDTLPGADLTFFIDGNKAGEFSYMPDGSGSYAYNWPLFAKENLEAAPHTAVMQNGKEGGGASLLLFDYLVYTKYVVRYRSCMCS